VEVADIFRRHGPAYRHSHRLPLSHLKAMHAIEVCRTAALGGHLEQCTNCGFQRPVYNSCRNRNCPKCQALAKARWLEQRSADLLPVGYFHNVFTLPHELNALAKSNATLIYNLLFDSVAQTLQAFADDPAHGLGGQLGFTAVLHTWDQKLLHHIHLHCLIPGGALAHDRQRWLPARPHFLFPVRALGRLFRGKFLGLLQHAFRTKQLLFPGPLAAWQGKLRTPSGNGCVRCGASRGSFIPRSLSAVRERCSTIWDATAIASPSPTTACAACKTARSLLTTAIAGTATASKR
jgi:hypothetical protein